MCFCWAFLIFCFLLNWRQTLKGSFNCTWWLCFKRVVDVTLLFRLLNNFLFFIRVISLSLLSRFDASFRCEILVKMNQTTL